MVLRVIECNECGITTGSRAYSRKVNFEKSVRESGWKQSKKLWYCPLHHPHTGANDSAEIFATQWRRLVCGNEADLLETNLYPMPEYKFDPTRKYSADFAFPEKRLLLEIDGGVYLKHGGRHNTDKDRDKLNQAAVLGWRVIRFSTQQLEADPLKCVNTVLAALGLDQITF